MGRRLLTWWESLAARHQILVAAPVAFVLLYIIHDAFFPLLTPRKALTYALMECLPLALLLTWATQNELRRRADAASALPGASDLDPEPGVEHDGPPE